MSRISARVKDGVTYLIEGNIAGVRLPAAGETPLWQHTCCELFVGSKSSPAYREFNFSPSGDWDSYAFDDYRKKGSGPFSGVVLSVRKTSKRVALEARLPIPRGALLGISAVIEETDGTLSYWALRHPPGKPDFHHREAFALEVE